MTPKPPKVRNDPEAKIRQAVINMLTLRGWYVKMTHGSMYQSGLPDLFATHSKYGGRWIEIKLPDMKGSHFTAAQLQDFPKFVANGCGIWILTSDSDSEYDKLFKPHNFNYYLLKKGLGA